MAELDPIKEPDIYSLGFDENLNRKIETTSSPLVYDMISDTISGAVLASGSIIGGGTITPSSLVGLTVTSGNFLNYLTTLGTSTLTAAATSITLSGIPTDGDNELLVYIHLINLSGATTVSVIFNNDSGANYAYKNERAFGGAIASSFSTTSLDLNNAVIGNESFYGVMTISNKTSYLKLCDFSGQATGNDTASVAPEQFALVGKWNNKVNLISSIKISMSGGFTAAVGSSITVLGRSL